MSKFFAIKTVLILGTLLATVLFALSVLLFGFSQILFQEDGAKFQIGIWFVYGGNLCLPLFCASGIMMAWLKHKRALKSWKPLGWLLFPLVAFGIILMGKGLRVFGI